MSVSCAAFSRAENPAAARLRLQLRPSSFHRVWTWMPCVLMLIMIMCCRGLCLLFLQCPGVARKRYLDGPPTQASLSRVDFRSRLLFGRNRKIKWCNIPFQFHQLKIALNRHEKPCHVASGVHGWLGGCQYHRATGLVGGMRGGGGRPCRPRSCHNPPFFRYHRPLRYW